MTPEQRARMQEAYDAYAAQKEGEPFTPLLDFIFLAGCRYQHEQTRERAAKAAETLVIGNYDLRRLATGPEAAAAIRALAFEDKP